MSETLRDTPMIKHSQIDFPAFSGLRCLMMPYVQGEPDSVPGTYQPYKAIIAGTFLRKGDIGFLTIDESRAVQGKPHRGARAKHGRALHTEAGRDRTLLAWGTHTWGGKRNVTLDRDVRVLLANSVHDSCAVWDAEQEDTSSDGDIGYLSAQYPYTSAHFMKAGEVYEIGVLTPHESLPVVADVDRQFLRIVSSGVYGREEYFTDNPLVAWP